MTAAHGLAMAIGDTSSGGGNLAVDGLTYSDSAGGNVFVEALPQTPDVAVVVKSFGGAEPDSGNPYDTIDIQILVRGDEDPETALSLWDALFDELHGAVQEQLPEGTYLVACIVQQAGPVNIGPDTNGRHRFSMNLRLETVHSTKHRP
jgi:hypothetical protein